MPVDDPRSPHRTIRPETELLLLCARTRTGPETARRIRELLGLKLDWIFFVRTALAHDLLPLVYVRLRDADPAAVPAGILDHLGMHFDEHVERNRRRADEVLRLLALLDARAIPALPFKGAVLAVAAYGDLSLRTFWDLDFLIRRRDAARGREVLLGAGYELKTPLGRDGYPSAGKYECVFLRERDGTVAELRWRLTPKDLLVSLDFERLGERRQLVTLNGVAVPALAAEDTLVMLCVHGGKHGWAVLKWVCDVAELVGATPKMNWALVEARARQLGCRRMVALGLRLAANLLDAPLPRDVSDRGGQDTRVTRLAARVEAQLLHDGEPGTAADETMPAYHRRELLDRFPDLLWHGWWSARRIAADFPRRAFRLLATRGLVPLVRHLQAGIRTRAG